MRRLLLATAAVALVAMQFGTAQANNDDTEGMVLLPTPIVGSGDSNEIGTFDCVPTVDAGCHKGSFSGLYRRLYLAGGDAVQGTFGYLFRITEDQVPFTLSSTGAAPGDFDISFYKDLGSLDPTAPAPNTDFGAARASYSLAGVEPETGTVPKGAKFAIVTCVCVGGSFKFDN